jgi:hypothetical protein
MLDQKIENAAIEISKLLLQQDSIEDSIKDICESAAEDSEEYSKADIKQIAKLFHKNAVADERAKKEKIWQAAEELLNKH